jgi:hypothetical protein
MRYLKRQSINRRIANDPAVYVDYNNQNVYITPVQAGSVIVPYGTTAQRPSSPINGMIRYNTDITASGELEIYQGSAWRSLRFKESTGITQQNLGAGDGAALYFGPLNPAPPSVLASGATWGPQNIIVVVENVIQVGNINYTVIQNPSTTTSTYTPTLSVAATVGSTTLAFNTSLPVIGASWATNSATITFATQTYVPYAAGASIIITGIAPSGYNGTYTVTSSTTGSVTYTLGSNPGIYQNGGEVDASTAVYPAVNILGATVSGANIPTSTTISGVSIVNTTYQFQCSSTTLAVNQAVVISGTNTGSGTINGSANGTGTYYITSTNGTTGFSLSLLPSGTLITTAVGTPAGLTYTLPVSVLSYNTNSTTDALTSIVISKATITSTIALNASITITEPATTLSGYYLKFNTPVPYGKVVIALIGFDQ